MLDREHAPTIYLPDEDVSGMGVRNSQAVRASYAVGRAEPGRAVLNAIQDDATLSALLTPPPGAPSQDDGWEFAEMVEDNIGRAERRRAFELPGLLVESAARNVLAAGGSTDDVAPIIEALPEVLEHVRNLISGQAGRAYVGAAFAGVRVPEGTRLHTPWGVLRCAAEPERSHRPGGSPEAWSIVEAEIPLRWTLGERTAGAPLDISEQFSRAQEKVQRLSLAGLLAFGQAAVPRLTWFYLRAPLRGWGPNAWPATVGWTGQPHQEPDALAPAQQEELVQWCNVVDTRQESTIAIAERRVLSAITDRSHSDEDALIDAVIAWENLFGHGSNVEMTFRVTASLAILLEPDPVKRPELAKELRRIYGDRSTVAHGGTLSAGRNLPGERTRAIAVAVEALRSLYRDYPDLLSDPGRGMRLILGGRPD
ncbi:MAG: hypothetical protein WAN93_09060 [Solirubrobacteraceae bacterium]